MHTIVSPLVPTAPAPHDEETLDPRDWEELRRLGHRMVDEALGFLATARERPAWRPTPPELHDRFRSPVPLQGAGPEAAYRAFLEDVRPWPLGNIHPRFWGWVCGTGTPLTALAAMLSASANTSGAGFDCAATLVEEQTVRWLRELLGFPPGGFGLFVSGGSVANLTALAVARRVQAEHDVLAEGAAAAPRAPVVYASRDTHGSVRRAVELLGLGRSALRAIDVDADRRIRVDELERAVRADRDAGRHPEIVVGNAGTVTSGAVDDLAALADLCAREGLWLHVDGCIGAPAWLCAEARPLLEGLQRADSLSFDLHKWLYMPFSAGCVLLRSEEEARDTFADGASYLARTQGGTRGHARWFGDLGIELTRPDRALPVWMSLREQGSERFGHMIAKNLAQARYLAQRVSREPELELLAPAPLNVVTFRYLPRGAAPGARGGALDELNAALAVRIQESGVAVPSTAVLDGRLGLRVAITNHRSRMSDFDVFVEALLALGRELAAAAPQASEA